MCFSHLTCKHMHSSCKHTSNHTINWLCHVDEHERTIRMAERAAIKVVYQSSPFHMSILNPTLDFEERCSSATSNTSSSRPESAHVPPKTRSILLNTLLGCCMTVARKGNSMLNYFVLVASFLTRNSPCFFRLLALGDNPLDEFHNLPFCYFCFRFFATKREKRIKAKLTFAKMRKQIWTDIVIKNIKRMVLMDSD